MFVERIYQDSGDLTAVKISDIVSQAGDGELFQHGSALYATSLEHLPQGSFSYAQRELGALVCRVPTEVFELKKRDILGAMQRVICETFVAQPLVLHDQDGQVVIWTSSGTAHEIDLRASL
jgi:hypothetical protein